MLLGDAALVAVELSLIGSSDSSDVGNLFKLICAQREQVHGKPLALLQAQSVALEVLPSGRAHAAALASL